MHVSWPLEKLDLPPSSSEGRPCLLLSSGAMNPIHRGHVHMLHQAAERLRAAGYAVLGAWVSPSHDLCVQPKALAARTVGLSARFRLRAAAIATAEDPLVSVSSWEAQQHGYWPEFPDVVEALRRAMQRPPSAPSEVAAQPEALRMLASATIFYVCGSDHATKCGLWRGRLEWGVVVVPRASESAHAERPAKRVFVAAACRDAECFLSSTRLRQALGAHDDAAVRSMVSPAAARFMLHPSTEEHSAFADDFRKLGISEGTAHASEGIESPLSGGRVRVIGITGCSRSGKGWISSGLQQLLADRGMPVRVIGQEAFWRQTVPVTVRGQLRPSHEEPECVDHQAFAAAVLAATDDFMVAMQHGIVIAEGFQLVHSPVVAQILDAIFFLELGKDEACRRRCQPQDSIANPNPMSLEDWKDLVWPAHERYVDCSLAPLGDRILTLRAPNTLAERDAIVRDIMMRLLVTRRQ